RLPAEFAFLGRMTAMLVGLCTSLSPTFNVVEVARPYARQFMYGRGLESALRLLGVESVEQLGRGLLREGLALARSVSALPHTLEHVLERAERGDLRLIVESPYFDPELRTRPNRRLARGLLNRPVPAWLPASIAGLLALTLLVRRRGTVG